MWLHILTGFKRTTNKATNVLTVLRRTSYREGKKNSGILVINKYVVAY